MSWTRAWRGGAHEPTRRRPARATPARRARSAHPFSGGWSCGERGRWPVLRSAQGRGAGHRRRIRLRQEHDRHEHPAPRGWRPRDRRRLGAAGRAGCAGAERSRHAPCAGRAHRHDLPGAHDLPQPGPHHRTPDHRGGAARWRQPPGGARAGPASAGAGAHRRARAAPRRLPPSALRRHAPAGHDRPRPVTVAADPHRRRAHDRAGRDRAGADPRPAAASARKPGHGDHPHHP